MSLENFKSCFGLNWHIHKLFLCPITCRIGLWYIIESHCRGIFSFFATWKKIAWNSDVLHYLEEQSKLFNVPFMFIFSWCYIGYSIMVYQLTSCPNGPVQANKRQAVCLDLLVNSGTKAEKSQAINTATSPNVSSVVEF